MPKLHELLAVEQQLKTQSESTRAELKNTFDKKKHLFEEKRSSFVPNKEGLLPASEVQSDIQSTVPQEFKWISGIMTKAMDTSYGVAEGNMLSRADVIMDDGSVVLSNVPATALMELEKRVSEIHELIKTAPTLDPAKGFRLDPDRGKDIFKAREITKTRTQKAQRVIVKYAATEHHPAQTELVSEDVPIGTITEQEWSGLITPARKSELLEKTEELKRAVKKAKFRANEVTLTVLPKCGDAIFAFVFGN